MYGFDSPTNDVSQIIGEVLRLNMDYMLHEDFGYYSYPEHYRFGDIVVLVSHDVSKGVLLELKGKAVGNLKTFYWLNIGAGMVSFKIAWNIKVFFKRLDLAINDKTGILNIPELAKEM